MIDETTINMADIPSNTEENPTPVVEEITNLQMEESLSSQEFSPRDEESGTAEALEFSPEGELEALALEFPKLATVSDIDTVTDGKRYYELRGLGLTPREAYLATAKAALTEDSRAHLRSTVPKGATAPFTGMTAKQLQEARELFCGMSDAEINSLYKKVTV